MLFTSLSPHIYHKTYSSIVRLLEALKEEIYMITLILICTLLSRFIRHSNFKVPFLLSPTFRLLPSMRRTIASAPQQFAWLRMDEPRRGYYHLRRVQQSMP